ncbi:L-lactate/malate dehydrogenase [Aaosphaeria arxii CBS 175.79]|uniref:L-lactate/malate dehydrogenase n=1 Tax=Aaosphaeria arxii CBS 175.79 TaxID=1450172 RepID=A0A6A5X8Z5_9PLEO|nr:L-lactate/malate dehydrogenase [Aaosphaeria arxii CBS 175.79]KAF2009356.1 L-lactate/malate dehydrogenase [Aaosphaeria arxii CBS 175.79]
MTLTIAIIGVGEVGAAAAYALILNNVCAKLLLVDNRSSHLDGQVKDLSDSAFKEQNGTRIEAATYREASQADIVIFAAAAKRGIGETTLQYRDRSAATLHNVIEAINPFKQNAILLVVSHPVDTLTTIAQRLSHLPPTQVIGTGTFLESIRLRGLLANQFGVAASSVDAMVLGKHGESQFVPWHLVNVGGVSINELSPSDPIDRDKITQDCRRKGEQIIEEKGAIAYGIASAVSTICTSILLDRRQVYPVSYMQENLGCALSMPAVLGRSGIESTLAVSLGSFDKQRLQYSASEIKKRVDSNIQ